MPLSKHKQIPINAPRNLSVDSGGFTSAFLTWDVYSHNHTGWEIEYSEDQVSWTSNGITTRAHYNYDRVSSLTAGTTYYFRVRAVNGSARSR